MTNDNQIDAATFHRWFDKLSVLYKNYQLKHSMLVEIMHLYYVHSVDNDSWHWKTWFRHIKWRAKILLNCFYRPQLKLSLQGKDIRNKNVYVISMLHLDKAAFPHINNIVLLDKNALVFAIWPEIYKHYCNLKIPVIWFDVYNPWRKIKNLAITIPDISQHKIFNINITVITHLLRAACLIDLLEIFCDKYDNPATLVTIQDCYTYDSTFVAFFKDKIPTITLQHGFVPYSDMNPCSYLLSRWMIVWGKNQAKILQRMGIEEDRLKLLGTAKYDTYLQNTKPQSNTKDRILIGVQPMMFLPPQIQNQVLDFLTSLLEISHRFQLIFRFHPICNVKKIVKRIKLRNQKKQKNYDIHISNIKDPLEDIYCSQMVFIQETTLALEAMLFNKPVIEYLSSPESGFVFDDYRNFCLHAATAEEAIALIEELIKNQDTYSKVLKKQKVYIENNIMSPPAAPRIINFINSVGNHF